MSSLLIEAHKCFCPMKALFLFSITKKSSWWCLLWYFVALFSLSLLQFMIFWLLILLRKRVWVGPEIFNKTGAVQKLSCDHLRCASFPWSRQNVMWKWYNEDFLAGAKTSIACVLICKQDHLLAVEVHK
jgi:hypothetical protein